MRSPRARRLFLLGVATFVAVVPAPSASAAGTACPNVDELPSRLTVKQVRVATLCLINSERRAHGLAPVRQHDSLTLAGSRHARDMVRARYFSHDSRSGRAFDDRIIRTGYARGRRASVGENLAWGSGTLATPRAIVKGWMKSPGHRANILQPAFREIGIGIASGTPATGDDGATYATEFGRRF